MKDLAMNYTPGPTLVKQVDVSSLFHGLTINGLDLGH